MSPNKKFNNYIIQGDIVKIEVKYKGKEFWTIIDISDLQNLINLGYHWCVRYDFLSKRYYVQVNIYDKGEHKAISLNNYLMCPPKGMDSDHINNDSLDNRRANLRLVERKNNARNRKGANSNNKSGIRNMCWINNYMRLQLQIDGKNYKFPEKFTEDQREEAREFSRKMREKYYGKFAGKG